MKSKIEQAAFLFRIGCAGCDRVLVHRIEHLQLEAILMALKERTSPVLEECYTARLHP